VLQQVFDGDGASLVGEVRQVLANIVLHRQLALLRQHQDADSGELLGDGTNAKLHVRLHRRLLRHVGQAIRLTEYRLAVARDDHRGAWPVRFEHRRQGGIQALLERRFGHRASSLQKGERCKENCR